MLIKRNRDEGIDAQAETPKYKFDTHAWMALRGAIGGLVAGLAFGLLQMWFLADAGLPAHTIIHLIATLVQPDYYFAAGQTSLALGWAIHITLSLAYGAIYGLAATEIQSNVTRMWWAAIYGGMIYLFNFVVLAPLFYGLFTTANQPFEAAVHVVYGALLGPWLVLWRDRGRPEPEEAPIVQQWRDNGGQPLPKEPVGASSLQPLPPNTTFQGQHLR